MGNIRSFKKRINQKTTMIALMTILVISSFVVINKYDLISRAIGYFAAINNGYTKEVKSVELKTTGYDTNQEGALKITKSAEWTGLNEATVKIKVESKPIDDQKDKDVIFLLDISESFGEGNALTAFQNNLVEAYQEIIDESTENRVALFTFSTNAEMKFDFTRDKTKLASSLSGLNFGGSTNFYNALKKIEQYLSSYTFQSDKELHLIFISDGFANEGRGADEKEYKLLKEKYPNLIIDGIREEREHDIYKEEYDIKRISDRQYYNVDYNGYRDESVTLKEMILDAALSKSYYSSINISDYINPTYFTYKSASAYYGKISKTTENGMEKVIWDLNDGKFKSGYAAELEIKLDLKSAYHGVEAYFPTNNNLTLSATDTHISNINTSTTNTPVLQSWFEVNYDSNTPTGCTSTYNKTEKYFPFSNVTIKGSNLTCNGWSFKGWEIDDAGVTRINSDTFVMPLRNVTVGAEWRQLSINKSMDGTINERSTLYEIISDQAKMDNVKSDYVSQSYGVNFGSISSDTNGKGVYTLSSTRSNKYPIRYFRGNIDNNNVIFGGKCWKIFRTTNTGGIKMVYNGVPSSGKCTASGSNTTIGQIKTYNGSGGKDYGSLASTLSYTYGTEYKTKAIGLGSDNWGEIVGIKNTYLNTSATFFSTPFYYSTTYTPYNATDGNQGFKLAGSIQSGTANDNMIGKYTHFSTKNPSTYYGYDVDYISSIDYTEKKIYFYRFSRANYSEAGGQDLYTYYHNKAKNTTWYYSNDVTYSNGTYTLVNPIAIKPYYYGDYIEQIANGHHYTCMTSSTTCSTVKYAFAESEEYLLQSYIELTGGKKIENAFDEMYISPKNTTKTGLASTIDNWYASNLTAYTYMLEDVPWCNDRYVENSPSSQGGWIKDGDSREYVYTNSWTYSYNPTSNPDECRTQDAYTVNTANGNGYLTYPVGTLTSGDLILAGGVYRGAANTSFYLYNGLNYWTMSPAYFNNMRGYMIEMQSSGKVEYTFSGSNSFIQSYARPAVSLKPGVFASSGNGTPNNPYIIEME